MTSPDLTATIARHHAAIQQANDERDTTIRAAAAAGKRQKDIIAETGLSRETVRQILNPGIREQVKTRRKTLDTAA